MDCFDIQIFHLFAGPFCFPEKFQTGGDARVFVKTIDPDQYTKFIPSIMINKTHQNLFKGFTMKRIIRLFSNHRKILIQNKCRKQIGFIPINMIVGYAAYYFHRFASCYTLSKAVKIHNDEV